MTIRLSKVKDKVLARLESMTQDPNFFPAWANTRALKIYTEGQMRRWMTEGASENNPWMPVSLSYGSWKAKKWAASFGAGTKTLIASSRLLASVLPPSFRNGPVATHGEEFRKLVTDKSLEISTAVEYAPFVDETRKFMTWSRSPGSTVDELKKDFKQYMGQVARGRSA